MGRLSLLRLGKILVYRNNTIKGSGSAATSGITDAGGGGRYVVRYNYIQNTHLPGVMAQKTLGHAACDVIRSMTISFTGQSSMATSFIVPEIPSGMTIRFWVETLALPITPLSLITGRLETQAIT